MRTKPPCQHLRDAPLSPLLNDGTRLPEGHMWKMRRSNRDQYDEWEQWWECLCCAAVAVRVGLLPWRRKWVAA